MNHKFKNEPIPSTVLSAVCRTFSFVQLDQFWRASLALIIGTKTARCRSSEKILCKAYEGLFK